MFCIFCALGSILWRFSEPPNPISLSLTLVIESLMSKQRPFTSASRGVGADVPREHFLPNQFSGLLKLGHQVKKMECS